MKDIFFLFGGSTRLDDKDLDNIYIFDTMDNKFRESKLKCPMTGRYFATISNNKDEEKLIVSGFVNDSYKTNEFIDLQIMPHYLIQLISNWYENQKVYLLRRNDDKPSLFTIKVDDIL